VPNLNQFIALGDSLTEGLSDKYPDGSYRGWADRVADEMSKHDQDFRYANLAVRGKLLEQVIADQLQVALPWMQGSQTLVTFHAGANNVLRPKFEPNQVFETYANAVAQIAATGSKILLFTVREVSNPQTKTQHYWNQRFGPFNENVKRVAAEFGATVMDANSRKKYLVIHACWHRIACTYLLKDTAESPQLCFQQLKCRTMRTGKIQCRHTNQRRRRFA
jgi:lysophospholipase L1-like esterase